MKVLTKHTDYAIRALLALATRKEVYVSAKTIAEEQAIPYQFLRRLLQDLIRNGLVVSKEGAGGGVRLAGNPDEIKIKDIIEIFQGKVQVSECMFRKQICANRANCVLRHEIIRIEQMVSNEFEKISIGKLLNDLNLTGGYDTGH
jgi:Rrf2 family protein